MVAAQGGGGGGGGPPRTRAAGHTEHVTRRGLYILAAAVAVVAMAVALLLPMYTCMDPYEFEDIQGPGAGPTCIVSDMGYTPDNWVPTKVTVAVAGIVAAIALVVWAQRRPPRRGGPGSGTD